jgi:hypothetical protein
MPPSSITARLYVTSSQMSVIFSPSGEPKISLDIKRFVKLYQYAHLFVYRKLDNEFITWYIYSDLRRRQKTSSSLNVHTTSDAHPAFYPMGTVGKLRSERDAEHSPHLVLRSRMSRSCTSCHFYRLNGVRGTASLLK